MTRAGAVDAVVIGRNEGSRLTACLRSLQGRVRRIIYVDSGSVDDSVASARKLGAEVVVLDSALPFTAARARNAGLARLDESTQFVQFVDGDCSVDADWIETAAAFLQAHPEAGVACGRRRERFPDASIYNRLCDLEWDTPPGPTKACGGDALIRYDVLNVAGGYRDDLIAGEEPELCVRLRGSGWQIWRLDHEMTLHDANMTRFAQWWRRTRRAGFAFAQGAALHGRAPEFHWVKETQRALFWGVILPAATLVAAAILSSWALLLLLAYPAQVLRLTPRMGLAAAFFNVLGKFAEGLGVLQFHWSRLGFGRIAIIEYKQ